MKAITLWQPWASLVMLGWKRYEFRSWAAPKALWGQRIVIHSSARRVRDDELMSIITGESQSCWPLRQDSHTFDQVEAWLQSIRRKTVTPPYSAGLGTVLLGEPKTAKQLSPDDDRVDPRMWGWPVSEPELFAEPVKCNGSQGFWNWAPEPDFFRDAPLSPSREQ
jgi:hypothetical protein